MATTASDLRAARARLAPLLAAALSLAGCAASMASVDALPPAEQAGVLRALQASDLRVATVAFRLASAGRDICPRTAAITGMTLHEPAQYAPALRRAVADVMRLSGRVGVLAVAPGSPADRGGLRADDALVSIGGEAVAATPPTRAGVYAGTGAAYGQLARAATSGSIAIVFERGGERRTATLVPVRGCVSQVQLLPSTRIHAKADGTHLSVTSALLDYVASDDELALVIAHEMAHNALGHRAQFEAQGIRRGLFGSYGADAIKVREAERAADRLGYFLMARAGYAPGVARSFWSRLYAGPAGGHSNVTTHPDLATRLADAQLAEQEIASAVRSGRVPTP